MQTVTEQDNLFNWDQRVIMVWKLGRKRKGRLKKAAEGNNKESCGIKTESNDDSQPTFYNKALLLPLLLFLLF